jgi:hypothetical protein
MAGFTFPDFGTAFPFQNLPAQLQASMQMPGLSGTPGRYAYASQNNLGLPTSSWPTLYGGPSGGYPPLLDMNSPLLGGQQAMSMGNPQNGMGGLLGSLAKALGSLPTHANDQTTKAGTPPPAAPPGYFSNGLGVDPNHLPGMLGGGAATTPQAQAFIAAYNQMNPQLAYSAQTVQNARNAGRNDLAYMMLAQGGQGLRDAAGAGANEINRDFYQQGGATTQFDPATIAALRALGALG